MALPRVVFAQASTRSLGGRSLFDAGPAIRARTVASVGSDLRLVMAAVRRLKAEGFAVLNATPIAINIAGMPETYERVFRTKLVEREITVRENVTSTFLDSPDTDRLGHIQTKGTPLSDLIEGVALEVPRIFLSEAATGPDLDYWHLTMPDRLASMLNATDLHSWGVNGQGVRVAMVDSGWYRHPFFTQRGYDVADTVLAPGADVADDDESGHGTGESANILALAPRCHLIPVKADFRNTIGAFNTAVALQPDIITCSWGSNTPHILSAADMVLAASVAAAVARGIIVIFSAGNGHAGFPGQHPDVISVGGTFIDPTGNAMASDYASAFDSQIFAGRWVPDVSGLVGMRPKAAYILLPVRAGSALDVGQFAGGLPFADGDQTTDVDGWAAFSGTSAAAPQVAGIAALMRQVAPNILPAAAKSVLMNSAIPVTAGVSSPVAPLHMGVPASADPRGACGAGRVDALAAVVSAYFTSTLGFSASSEDVVMDPYSEAYLKGMSDAAAYALAASDPTLADELLAGAFSA